MSAPEFVVVRETVPEFAGQRAEIVRRQQRRRGPNTTDARVDYWLRFANGFEGWFLDEEVQADAVRVEDQSAN